MSDAMSDLTFNTKNEDETVAIATRLGELLRNGDVVTLDGDLGAGKTRMAQGIARGLGIDEPLVSPTFNLVFEYHSGRIPLYHFDLYRLESADELEDIDFSYLVDEGSAGVAVIEWASLFPDEMPDDRIEVRIEKTQNSTGNGAVALVESVDEHRTFRIHPTGTRSRERVEKLGQSLNHV